MIITDKDREEQTTPNYPTQAQIDAFNDLLQECDKLKNENTQWRERYAELEEKVEELEKENNHLKESERNKERIIHQLEMEFMYEDELFSNESLSPAHQTVLRTIRRIIKKLRVDESTPTPIRQREIANKTGLSDVQIRRIT